MKTDRNNRKQASITLITLVTAGILGMVLASYLMLVRTQNISTLRAQAWNSVLPVAEAGIEESLIHINTTGITNWASNGWTLSDGNYVKTRDFTNYSWSASITAADPPSITVNARVPTVVGSGFFAALSLAPENSRTFNVTSRGVRVGTIKNGLFTKGMFAKSIIDLKGNNVSSDSFDSSNPLYSTGGLFDPNPAKLRDNGDIATNAGITNSISSGNANIWGRAATGPGGSVYIGPNGAIGSKAWNTGGNKGAQPGWVRDDMNVWVPDIDVPFTSGFTPTGGNIGSNHYDYLLTSGDYVIDDLTLEGLKELYVTGNARLYVTTTFAIKGNSKITIAPGGNLELYMGGPTASIGGNGIANLTGNAGNFVYIGLPTNTALNFSGNGTFTGVVYAPSAAFSLGGSGNGVQDFIGSSVSNTVTMNGHFHFHYDEALKKSKWSRGYIPNSWDEI